VWSSNSRRGDFFIVQDWRRGRERSVRDSLYTGYSQSGGGLVQRESRREQKVQEEYLKKMTVFLHMSPPYRISLPVPRSAHQTVSSDSLSKHPFLKSQWGKQGPSKRQDSRFELVGKGGLGVRDSRERQICSAQAGLEDKSRTTSKQFASIN
jgi:hypothetical protein